MSTIKFGESYKTVGGEKRTCISVSKSRPLEKVAILENVVGGIFTIL
jgi:hypothetical protein